jgi:hypothetical protein
MGVGGGVDLRGRALLSLRLLGLQAAQGLAGLLFVAVQGLHHLFAALGGCRVGGGVAPRGLGGLLLQLAQGFFGRDVQHLGHLARPRGLLDTLNAVAQLARLGQQGLGA